MPLFFGLVNEQVLSISDACAQQPKLIGVQLGDCTGAFAWNLHTCLHLGGKMYNERARHKCEDHNGVAESFEWMITLFYYPTIFFISQR